PAWTPANEAVGSDRAETPSARTSRAVTADATKPGAMTGITPGSATVSPVTDLSVTLYRAPLGDSTSLDLDNLGGFALVSETRTIAIPAGESRIRFAGVADGIESASAIITGLPA